MVWVLLAVVDTGLVLLWAGVGYLYLVGSIDAWNDRCHPFVWTKGAEEILNQARPRRGTSLTGR